jgi:hypothetical protein
LLVARVPVVGADFVPHQTGEVMPDGDAGVVIDRVTGGVALQRVIGFIVGVLEFRRESI